MSLCGSVALTRGRRKRARYTCLGAFFLPQRMAPCFTTKGYRGLRFCETEFQGRDPFLSLCNWPKKCRATCLTNQK